MIFKPLNVCYFAIIAIISSKENMSIAGGYTNRRFEQDNFILDPSTCQPLFNKTDCTIHFQQCDTLFNLGEEIEKTRKVLVVTGGNWTRHHPGKLSRINHQMPGMLQRYREMISIAQNNLVGSNRRLLKSRYRTMNLYLNLTCKAMLLRRNDNNRVEKNNVQVRKMNTMTFDLIDHKSYHDWKTSMRTGTRHIRKQNHHWFLTEFSLHIKQLHDSFKTFRRYSSCTTSFMFH